MPEANQQIALIQIYSQSVSGAKTKIYQINQFLATTEYDSRDMDEQYDWRCRNNERKRQILQ